MTGLNEQTWQPDILGPGFSALKLPLESAAGHGPDSSTSPPTATLVRYDAHADPGFEPGIPAPATEVSPTLAAHLAVVYVHGWSDYFFHVPLARFWAGLGAQFYAIDLRNYGRNLDPDDQTSTPGLVSDLSSYGQEFSAALAVIHNSHPNRQVIFHAHSTGGLSSVLWAADNPGALSGLILNSPWLEFHFNATARKILTPLLGRDPGRANTGRTGSNGTNAGSAGSKTGAGATALMLTMPNYYTLAVAQAHGKLPFDQRLKPPESFPVYPQFLRAVFAGHERVAEGLNLNIPVLAQMSKHSMQSLHYSPKMAQTDIVLNVELLAARAVKLGDTVIVDRIPGAMHDLFLSLPKVRDDAMRRIVNFVRGYLPPPV